MSYLSKSVAIATGVTLTYAEKGDPAGVPVVFIHGITDSHLSYGPVLDVLPSGFSCLCGDHARAWRVE